MQVLSSDVPFKQVEISRKRFPKIDLEISESQSREVENQSIR